MTDRDDANLAPDVDQDVGICVFTHGSGAVRFLLTSKKCKGNKSGYSECTGIVKAGPPLYFLFFLAFVYSLSGVGAVEER